MTRTRYLMLSSASVGLVLVVWTLATRSAESPFVPSPAHTVTGLIEYARTGFAGHTMAGDLAASFKRVGLALGAAILVGFPLALAMGWSKIVYSAMTPLVEAYRPIPPLGYLPLLALWFGIGELSKVILLFLGALPSILLLGSDAVLKVRTTRVLGARSLGASEFQVFFKIVLPSALPDLLTATRVAFGMTYATVVSAELVAAQSGVGAFVIDALGRQRQDLLMAGIFLLAAGGLVSDGILRIVYRQTCSWAAYA